jgi:hypothetical protein
VTSRAVLLPAGEGLSWVLAPLELVPPHTRAATPEALDELAARYLPEPDALGPDAFTDCVLSIVAGLLAAREPGGPPGD